MPLQRGADGIATVGPARGDVFLEREDRFKLPLPGDLAYAGSDVAYHEFGPRHAITAKLGDEVGVAAGDENQSDGAAIALDPAVERAPRMLFSAQEGSVEICREHHPALVNRWQAREIGSCHAGSPVSAYVATGIGSRRAFLPDG